MNERVVAVVVSYNVRGLLLTCVGSLVDAQQGGELQSIVVVDNASQDGSVVAVRDRFPGVRVIEAPNRGYGAGANVGIVATDADLILVLNPDTVVPSGTVDRMARFLVANQDVALVGPRLRYPDGRIQPTIRRFPARLTPLFESTIIEEWWPGNPWSRRFHMRDATDDVQREVDWVVGAAILVRRAAIEQAGAFDEAFRMYSEETEWCWRLRRHGWKIAYLPDVEIIHHEGASARQNLAARQIAFDTSRVRLTRVLYGRSAAEIIRVGLLTSYALRLMREGLKWLIGHRRKLRRQRIEVYRAALRSGLREQASS